MHAKSILGARDEEKCKMERGELCEVWTWCCRAELSQGGAVTCAESELGGCNEEKKKSEDASRGCR